jgi:hypothetical protein
VITHAAAKEKYLAEAPALTALPPETAKVASGTEKENQTTQIDLQVTVTVPKGRVARIPLTEL